MSERYSWSPALQVGFYLEPTGSELGDGVVEEGNVALVLGEALGSDFFVVEGTTQEIARVLAHALVYVLGYDADAEEEEYLDNAHPMQTVEVNGDFL